MQLHEVQQLAREVAQAILDDGCAIGRRHRRFGQELLLDELREAEAERLLFDALDRRLWTP